MGVDATAAAFVMACVRNGVRFDRLCTVGRQHLHTEARHLRRAALQSGDPDVVAAVRAIPKSKLIRFSAGDPFWRAAGAQTIDSLDHSAFEGATILADLNEPIPMSLHRRYSVVYDGGVTEHVLNAPQSIRNAAAMVEPGGHLLSLTPANDQCGHGLYQLSAEFYYRLLGATGEFDRIAVLLCVRGVRTRWYALDDPGVLGHRVSFASAGAADLCVVARRALNPVPTGSEDRAGPPVQQSDYQAQWTAPAADAAPLRRGSRRRDVIRRVRNVAVRGQAIAGIVRHTDGVTPISLARWSFDE